MSASHAAATPSSQASLPLRRSLPLSRLDPHRSTPYKTHPKVRGYVDGCFDVMHSGHYNLSHTEHSTGHARTQSAKEAARQLCDELVVGVHSSSEIERTKKCKPVQTDEERMRLVASVKWVDEVVLSRSYSPNYMQVLEQLVCDFCIHGSDVSLDAEGKDPFEEVRKKGKLRSIERVDFISSTDIIQRLLKATDPDLRMQRRTEDEEDADSFLLTTDRLCQFMNTTRHHPHVPREGQRVVYVSGSFDLFHSGHVRLLQEAKALGDFLIVGLHEDTSVQTHCGPGFPIMNLFERSMNVLGCRDVDECVFDAPFVLTEHMIHFLKIDVVVELSMRIDYPHDSEDPYKLLRDREIRVPAGSGTTPVSDGSSSSAPLPSSSSSSSSEGLSSKLLGLLKPNSEEERRVRACRLFVVELPKGEGLDSDTLHKRINENREAYEERNKEKGIPQKEK